MLEVLPKLLRLSQRPHDAIPAFSPTLNLDPGTPNPRLELKALSLGASFARGPLRRDSKALLHPLRPGAEVGLVAVFASVFFIRVKKWLYAAFFEYPTFFF